MVTVKIFKDGEMINQTESEFAVVFTGSDDENDENTARNSVGVYGELSVSDLEATVSYGTVKCITAACREFGIKSHEQWALINTIAEAIREEGLESILTGIMRRK